MTQANSKTLSSWRRRSGVTLVEIMIAMVILSFGLLGVAALQVRAITEGSGGKHLTEASSIARNRIEELNRLAWDAVVLDDSAGAWSLNFAVPGVIDQGYNRAERVVWDNADPDLVTIKSIEVRVVWSDNKRQDRQVLLSSARLREMDE